MSHADCAARLYDDRQELRCNRNERHYNKQHRAVGSWMTSDGRSVDANVTWDARWDDDEVAR